LGTGKKSTVGKKNHPYKNGEKKFEGKRFLGIS